MGMLNPNPPECPILWQDDEAIHQDALQRQLILPDDPKDNPPQLRSVAFERWMFLAQQAAMKAAGMAPPMPSPGGGAPPNGAQPKPPAGNQPIAGTNPGVATGAASMLNGNERQANAQQHDAASHQ